MEGKLIQHDTDGIQSEARSSGPLSDQPVYHSSSNRGPGKSTQTDDERFRLAEEENKRRQQQSVGSGSTAVLIGQVVVRANGQTSPPLDGVVDTAATVSVIPNSLVRSWHLKPIGDMRLRAWNSSVTEHDRFWVEILIPDLSTRLVRAVSADRPDVLLGHDVLDQTYFTYDGANKTYSLYEHGVVGRLVARLLHASRHLRDLIVHRRQK